MNNKRSFKLSGKRIIAFLMALLMVLTIVTPGKTGLSWVNAQTEDVGTSGSGKLVTYENIKLYDKTTGEIIVDNGVPTGNKVNENDYVAIEFHFLIGTTKNVEKDENGNYLTFSTTVDTTGGKLKPASSDELPDEKNDMRDIGDWKLSEGGLLTVDINDKAAESPENEGFGFQFLIADQKYVWVTWEGQLNFSNIKENEAGQDVIDIIVAGQPTTIPVNIPDNNIVAEKSKVKHDGNDVYYDANTEKYYVDYKINIGTDRGKAVIEKVDDNAGDWIGADFKNLSISKKNSDGSLTALPDASLSNINTQIRSGEEIVITYTKEVKPDFINGSNEWYDPGKHRTNTVTVTAKNNHDNEVTVTPKGVVYGNGSPGVKKEGTYKDGKITWNCTIEIPKDSFVVVDSIKDTMTHTILPVDATDGTMPSVDPNITDFSKWTKVSSNPEKYTYTYATDLEDYFEESTDLKATNVKNNLEVVFKDKNGNTITKSQEATVDAYPGPGESNHETFATVDKAFAGYSDDYEFTNWQPACKWEIRITTPSEEDMKDLKWITVRDLPKDVWKSYKDGPMYLVPRIELGDGKVLYYDETAELVDENMKTNNGVVTAEGEKYFDTSFFESNKNEFPFNVLDRSMMLAIKPDNLEPETTYTFVVYTRTTNSSDLNSKTFDNDVTVETIYKDTDVIKSDKDTANTGILKKVDKWGTVDSEQGTVINYTVSCNFGAYAKEKFLNGSSITSNDVITFDDILKTPGLEYVKGSAKLECRYKQINSDGSLSSYEPTDPNFSGKLEETKENDRLIFKYTLDDSVMNNYSPSEGTFKYNGNNSCPILLLTYSMKLSDEMARNWADEETEFVNSVTCSYNDEVIGESEEQSKPELKKPLAKDYNHKGNKISYVVTVNPDQVKYNEDGSRLFARDIAGSNLTIIKSSIKVSDENGELTVGSGKDQYDYKLGTDSDGRSVTSFNLPDGKKLTVSYTAYVNTASNIIQATDDVSNRFELYKSDKKSKIDDVSNSIETGEYIQNSGGSSVKAEVKLSKVWFNGQKYISLSNCKFEVLECTVENGKVLVGDRVKFDQFGSVYKAEYGGSNEKIAIAEQGTSVKDLDYAKLYLLHETDAPDPLNKTDFYFIISNDSGTIDALKVTDEEFAAKYTNLVDEAGNPIEVHKYKDSNAVFEIEDYVEFELQAKKTVVFDNGNPAPMGTYTFDINEVDSDKADAKYLDEGYAAAKQNDSNGNVDFDPIRITMTSDEEYYYYKVSEDRSSLPTGTTGDDTFYIITMHVKRNDSGEFVHELAYVKYAKDEISGEYIGTPVSADEIKFNNIVESGDAGSIQISKKIKIDGTDKTSLFEDKEYLFTVKDSNNNYYDIDGNKSSDEVTVAVKAGETVTIGGLKPGEYTVVEKESSTPLLEYRYKGLNIDPLLGEVTVVKDEIANVVAVNNYETKTAPVKIIKKDVEDEKLLGGAVFELTGTGLSEAVTKTTISATGEITFDELLYGGTYELKEVKAPDGYALSASSPWTIKVSDSGVVTIQGNGEEHASVYTSAGFVVYNKKAASKLTITKSFSGDVYDSDKEVVHFLVLDEAGKVVKDFHYSEMEDGKMTLDLVPGKYTVIEEPNGREGYTIKTTYSVDSDYEEGIVLKTDYTDDGVKIDLVNDDNMIVSFKNVYSRDTGNIKITKKFVDANNNTIDISSLTERQKKYIKFIIIGPDDYNGKGFREVSLLDFDNLTYEEKNVPTGEYVIIESWPNGVKVDGYEFDDYVVSKKVNGQTSSEDTIMLGKGDSAEFLFDNIFDTGKGEISITKIIKIDGEDKSDLYSDKAYYFTVKDDLYYYDAAGNKSDSEVKIPVKAGEEVKVKNLEPNTYTVAETEDGTALGDYRFEGVTLSPETGDVVVGAGTTVEVTATNDYVTKTAAIKLIKKDAKDKTTTLGGAKFELTGTGIETTQKTTLNANGEVEFDNLLYGGTYELKEVGAPEDYVISKSSPWTVNVASNGVVTIKGADEDSFKTYTSAGYEIFNEKPEAVITVAKTFEGTADDSIKNNVKFLVSDKDGKTVADFTYADMTDGKKNIAVKPGKYTVSEEAADVSGYTVTRKYSVDSSVDAKDVAEKEYVGDAVSLDVSDKEEVTVAFKNDYQRKAFIEVTKSVSGDHTSLTAAEKQDIKFVIKDSSDKEVASFTYADMTNGKKTVEVDPGESFYVVEEASDIGDYKLSRTYDKTSDIDPSKEETAVYKADDKVETGVMQNGETVTVKFTNTYTAKKGSLVITKNVKAGGYNYSDKTKTFNFTVKNVATGKYYNKVATAFDTAQKINVGAGESVTIDDLPVGNYEVTELLEASDLPEMEGYTYLKTKVGEAEVNTVNVEIKDNEVQENTAVTFVNEYKRDRGSLKILKTFEDEDGNVIPSSKIDKSKISFTVTGPEDFEITISYADFTDGQYRIDDLRTGKYSVKETVSDGSIENYTISSTLSTMSLNDIEVTKANDKNNAAKAEFKNVYTQDTGKLKIKKSFTFTKYDGTGADISLSDEAKSNIKFTVTGPDDYSFVVSYKDFTNGEYEISGLKAGTYTVKESGYDKEGLIDSYSFDADASNVSDKEDLIVTAVSTPVAEFKNAYTEDTGYLTVKKTVKVGNAALDSTADTKLIGRIYKITVKNSKGKYVLDSVDENGNARLTDSKEDAILTIKDGEELTLGKLEVGTYVVEEDEADAIAGESGLSGLNLSDRYGLEVTGTGEVVVTKAESNADADKAEIVNNYLSKKFAKLVKTDVDGNVLSGAQLSILSSDGTTVLDSWTSDKNKEHYITSLVAGETYILQETVAPAGYSLTTNSTFTFDEDGKVTVSGAASATSENGVPVILVKDELTSVKISKNDITSGTELKGATLQVLDETGNVVNISGEKLEWISGSEPKEIKGLTTGKKYILRETVAPEGYSITTDTYFQLKADGTVDTANTTTKTDTDGVLLVEDAMTSVKISKVDITSGEELAGATIQILDEYGNDVSVNGTKIEWVSTTEAHEIKGLTTGKKYILRETVAPEGYCIATDTYFELNEDGTVNATKTTTKINDTSDNSLLVEDSLTRIYISKKDVEGINSLEGGVLQILNEDMTIAKDKDGNEIEVVTTDGEYTEITGLVAGKKYYIHEKTAPKGYKLTADLVFTLKEDGTVDFKGATKEVDGHTVMIMKDAVTSLNFTKVGKVNEKCADDSKKTEPLEGVTFKATLLDTEGKPLTNDDAFTATAVSNETGSVIFNNIPAGDYMIEEVSTLDHYELDDTVYYAKVSDAEDSVFEGLTRDFEATDAVVNNTLVNDQYRTDIVLQKVAENDPSKSLPGSLYELTKEVVTADGSKATVVVARARTGFNGKLKFAGVLADVEYTITEVEEPDGYYLSERPIHISFRLVSDPQDPSNSKVVFDATSFDGGEGTATVDENGNITWLEPVTVVKFAKYDEAGHFLPGATLQVVDKKGNVIVEPWISGTDYKEVSGIFISDASVEYRLVELAAPKGYEKAADVVFHLDDEKVGPNAGREIIVSMTDKLSPVVKEADVSDGKSEGKNDSVTNIQTGDNAPIIPVAGLMILSLVGFVVIFSKKKKNKKEAKE